MKSKLKIILASILLCTFVSLALTACKREVPEAKEAKEKKEAEAADAKAAPAASESAEGGAGREAGAASDDADQDGVQGEADKCPDKKPEADTDKDGCPDDAAATGEETTGTGENSEDSQGEDERATTNAFKVAVSSEGDTVSMKFLNGEAEISVQGFDVAVQGQLTIATLPNNPLSVVLSAEEAFKTKFIESCGEVETKEVTMTFSLGDEDAITVLLKFTETCTVSLKVPEEFTLQKLLDALDAPNAA
jgi:hypothetical protein